MSTWSTRGLRGSLLEDMINFTIDHLRTKHLALIQKIPTPIKPINIDKETRHITLAYFDQKSTVDYIGVVQSIPVCFDAKECATQTFPMQNVHAHQMEFMKDFELQGGIAFFLCYFTHINKLYYVPYKTMKVFWDRAKEDGKKSFRIEELRDLDYYEVAIERNVFIKILDTLQLDLERREEAEGKKS